MFKSGFSEGENYVLNFEHEQDKLGRSREVMNHIVSLDIAFPKAMTSYSKMSTERLQRWPWSLPVKATRTKMSGYKTTSPKIVRLPWQPHLVGSRFKRDPSKLFEVTGIFRDNPEACSTATAKPGAIATRRACTVTATGGC